MKTLSFNSNQERDQYLAKEYRDRRETVSQYVWDVPGGTISVYERTIVFEAEEGQNGEGIGDNGNGAKSIRGDERSGRIPVSAASGPASAEAGAFAILRQDHQKISSLATKVRSRLAKADTDGAYQLFQTLKSEVGIHAKIEDMHIYRIFQQADATRDAARVALEAHTHIQSLIDELSEDSKAPRWPERFRELHEALSRHMEEEERDPIREGGRCVDARRGARARPHGGDGAPSDHWPGDSAGRWHPERMI